MQSKYSLFLLVVCVLVALSSCLLIPPVTAPSLANAQQTVLPGVPTTIVLANNGGTPSTCTVTPIQRLNIITTVTVSVVRNTCVVSIDNPQRPNLSSNMASYTVTAVNSAGRSSAAVAITVQ